MKISNLYVRFYRSFNFDYLRKFSRQTHDRPPWEMLGDRLWYPYVRVPIEESITTVVGANESGKSHLLSAIKAALTGEDFDYSDFCRYSQFFVVNEDMRLPDFGLEFSHVSPQTATQIAACCEGSPSTTFDRFALFRAKRDQLTVYLVVDQTWTPYPVSSDSVATIEALLPRAFEIDASVPLPDSASIEALSVGRGAAPSGHSREGRASVFTAMFANRANWFSDQNAVTAHAGEIYGTVAGLQESEPDVTKAELADDLLVKIAKVERRAFQDLAKALREGDEGYANGIIDEINRSLASALNLKRWWTQDEEFQLLVSPREFELAFTIRDRTGTDYSFGERSTGLKYFLSYLVQYLAHESIDGRTDLLLMDEPDAYLSSQGQQDLLRILDAFATGEDEDHLSQVVYVTHSPFLIDKNHADRIRVLEKGDGDEGTRVVKRAGSNHYEPLRSAFGGFIGETTFISNCNLMVEGESDQVLLAGMSTHLRSLDGPIGDSLDLNKITLVHAGGASHIPYMVFLARGRDVERPAVIVLFDKDAEGTRERGRIKKGGPSKKSKLDDKFVHQFGDGHSTPQTERTGGDITIEDLLPIEVCVAAAALYAKEFLYGDGQTYPTAEEVRASELSNGHLYATEAVFKTALGEDFHLDKIGFARSVIEVIARPVHHPVVLADGVRDVVETNFRRLFQTLNKMQRAAMREYRDQRVTVRIRRSVASFLDDHPSTATNELVKALFEDVESVLDNTVEADAVRVRMREIVRDFEIDGDPIEGVGRYVVLRDALLSIEYAGIQEVEEPGPEANPAAIEGAPTDEPPG
jgi:energy-coupling factor transporter ATP-binding protein EcfA2